MQSVLGRIIDSEEEWSSLAGNESPVTIEYRVQVPITEVKALGDDLRIRGPVYVGDDEMLDRHSELVESDAILNAWTGYEKNPVILYNHSKTYGVIGIMENVEMGEYETPEGRVLSVPIGTALIDGGETNIVRKIEKGMLRAFSIGFIAKAGVKECTDDDTCYLKFTDIEWLETSVVDVPASPGALFSVEKTILGYNSNDRSPLEFKFACGCDSDFDKSDSLACVCAHDAQIESIEADRELSVVEELAEIKASLANLQSMFKTDSLNTPLSQPTEQPEGLSEMSEDIPSEVDEDKIVVIDEKHVGGEARLPDGQLTPDSPLTLEAEPVVEEVAAEEEVVEEAAEEEVVAETPKKTSKKSVEADEGDDDEEEEEEEAEDESEEEEAEAEAEAESEEAEEEEEEEEEEDLPEEAVEASADLPTTTEVLMSVVKAVMSMNDSVKALEARLDETDSLKSLLAEANTHIESLTEEKTAAEAEAAIDKEVSKRLAELTADMHIAPKRKTLVQETTASKPKATDVTRFDPQPEVTPGMNGLAGWLAERLGER